jgi:hypothetical protein
MLNGESAKVMVSGAQVGRGLIGYWTVKMNSPSRKHVASSESELSPCDPVGGQRLVWVWSLRSECVA